MHDKSSCVVMWLISGSSAAHLCEVRVFWMQSDKVGRPPHICEHDAIISEGPSATYCPYVHPWPSLHPCILCETWVKRAVHDPHMLVDKIVQSTHL